MNDRIGVWLIGARGAIATGTACGVSLLAKEIIGPTGVLTAHEPFSRLGFVDWAGLVFGGCDIVEDPALSRIDGLVAERILPWRHLDDIRGAVRLHEENIVLIAPGGTAGAALDQVRGALADFRARNRLERIIVVDVSSTEALPDDHAALSAHAGAEALQRHLLSRGGRIPWSLLYALAAALEGCAYINFTPNLGVDVPGLEALMRERRLPYAGKDGKTGETLLRTVLAPMFTERRLDVLSWQGYNMLGNGDGRSLADPKRRASKLQSKGQALSSLLNPDKPSHVHVAIDYVPSLGDWKTAWNFVHFQGFFDVPMTFQFTWAGCDTVLAVPLVIDLVRWVERAWRQGEGGHLGYLGAYFKAPHRSDVHDFRRQMQDLQDYAAARPGAAV